MKKRSLLTRISKGLPGYKLFSDYFLRLTPHAMVGYALDVSPTWLYVWECTIPLCDPVPFLHLTLSNRIGEPVRLISEDGRPRDDLDNTVSYVLDLVKRPRQNEPVASFDNLLEFIGNAEDIDIYSRKIRGFARSYLGDVNGAANDLKPPAEVYLANPSQAILTGADQVLALLMADPDAARAKLMEWERDKKQRFELNDLN